MVSPSAIDVSVLIPVHNKAAYLDECLDSILSQTGANFEVICVDDGSTDGSSEILARRVEVEPRLRVLNQSCAGPSAARNVALDHARGAYVLFVDADDALEPGMLERVVSSARKCDAQVVLFGWSEWYPETGASIPHYAGAGLHEGDIFSLRSIEPLSLFVFTPSSCVKLFSRAWVESQGARFHEDIRASEDLAFTYEVFADVERMTVIPDLLYRYRQRVAHSLITKVPAHDCLTALDYIAASNDGAYLSDPLLRRHFANLVLDTAHYALDAAQDSDSLTKLYQIVQRRWMPFLREHESDIDAFFLPMYRKLCQEGAFEYAVTRVGELRRDVTDAFERASVAEGKVRGLEERCRELEERIGNLMRDQRMVRGSYAFKVGRVLTWLPSRVRAALKGGR